MNIRAIIALFIILSLSPHAIAKNFVYKRQIIKEVNINGNRYFSEGKILNILLTKPNKWYNVFKKRRISRTNIKFDVKQLLKLYNQNGFLFTVVVDTLVDYYENDSSMVTVAFNINEGKQVYVDYLEIHGGLPGLNENFHKFTRNITPGEPVNNDAVLAAAFRIRDNYSDNGYPYAKVTTDYEYTFDSTEVAIHYDIAESCFVYNGDIEISREGKSTTKESVLKRELLVESGKPYSRKLNIESRQRLYSTGILKFIKLKKSDELVFVNLDTSKADTAFTNIRLIVTERKSNFINFRFGINQDEDFNSVFRTSVSWGNRNLWGTGRKLIFSVGNSIQLAKKGVEEERAITVGDLFSDLEFKHVKASIEASYIEPWFLGCRMPLSIGTIYEPSNKDPIYDKYYDRISGTASLFKDMNRYTNVTFSARVEFVDYHGASSAEAMAFRLEGDNSIRRRLSVYGRRDTRDNIFMPQRGSYSYTSLEYVGHYLGGDFNYIKGEFYWSRYKFLFGDNLLASRFRIGAIEELGNNGRTSTDDRFKLGGAKTVRGFAENMLGPVWTKDDDVVASLIGLPKGGKLLILTNFELRRSLFWRIGGSVFVDIGNVFFDIRDFKLNEIVSTSGLGLHFFTPVGPLRFEYAFVNQRELDLSEGSYHLTLLYAF
ncbi:MAG: BamA/TamA family outer membrane protein [candidate division Zixibacteria bacterium]|nr:BamA/TamA family outer membrane protein [candidate division Zixibacteria bacterium]